MRCSRQRDTRTGRGQRAAPSHRRQRRRSALRWVLWIFKVASGPRCELWRRVVCVGPCARSLFGPSHWILSFSRSLLCSGRWFCLPEFRTRPFLETYLYATFVYCLPSVCIRFSCEGLPASTSEDERRKSAKNWTFCEGERSNNRNITPTKWRRMLGDIHFSFLHLSRNVLFLYHICDEICVLNMFCVHWTTSADSPA